MSFRQTVERITPPWLNKYLGVGPRFMYLAGLFSDAIAEATAQGVLSRFPGQNDTSLNQIGKDRRIVRGPEEPSDNYAIRLRRWRKDWRKAGSPFPLMGQIAGILSPYTTRIRIVTNSGIWYTRDADGTESFYKPTTYNWDWDSNPDQWWRFWIIVYNIDPWEQADLWSDPGVWDTPPEDIWPLDDVPASIIELIRFLSRRWAPAHAHLQNIIVAFDDASFDPTTPAGDPDIPGGDWDDPSNRLTSANYYNGY